MKAGIKQITPTATAEFIVPNDGSQYLNNNTIGTTEPLTTFGVVVATVALKLVPNCSAAIVTKMVQ